MIPPPGAGSYAKRLRESGVEAYNLAGRCGAAQSHARARHKAARRSGTSSVLRPSGVAPRAAAAAQRARVDAQGPTARLPPHRPGGGPPAGAREPFGCLTDPPAGEPRGRSALSSRPGLLRRRRPRPRARRCGPGGSSPPAACTCTGRTGRSRQTGMSRRAARRRRRGGAAACVAARSAMLVAALLKRDDPLFHCCQVWFSRSSSLARSARDILRRVFGR